MVVGRERFGEFVGTQIASDEKGVYPRGLTANERITQFGAEFLVR